MTTLILSQSDIRRLLPMDHCIDLMAEALTTLARGRAQNPLRSAIRLADRNGVLAWMPGYLEDPPVLGLKALALFHDAPAHGLDSHQGIVALFDPTTGAPLAILEASEVTAIRTAAVSGLATRLLARADAGDLAILGSGTQAKTHLEAMAAVRTLRRVRVYSPNEEHRQDFAAAAHRRYRIPVDAVATARAAVLGADLVCTTTSSRDPVIRGAWLAPGVHINAAGSSVPSDRELDAAAIARSRLFVDRRESTLAEAGDFLLAKQEGNVDDSHIQGELGEILLGSVPGRTGNEEITLFKSLGLAIEDLAAAAFVVERARATGAGVEVELGGLREPYP